MRFLAPDKSCEHPSAHHIRQIGSCILWALSAESHCAPACSVEQNMSQLLIFTALFFIAVIAALDLWARGWGEADRIRSWWVRRAGR